MLVSYAVSVANVVWFRMTVTTETSAPLEASGLA